MILGTAWPLLRRSGESLFDAVPGSIDVQGVQEDIERISGSKSVHDLHVWSLGE
jgi:zinc transporter 1